MSLDPEMSELLGKMKIAFLEAKLAIEKEIDRLDTQSKRWTGFWGFFRFCWDDLRGKTD